MVHPVTTAAEAESDTATSDGVGSAAEIDLGDVSTRADVFVETTGAATLTVEVSTDGSTWREAATESYGSATTAFEQYEFAYQHVRAYLDTATEVVELTARGL